MGPTGAAWSECLDGERACDRGQRDRCELRPTSPLQRPVRTAEAGRRCEPFPPGRFKRLSRLGNEPTSHPGDLLTERSQNGYFHLGDITLRLRTEGSTDWKNYSTSSARTPVKTLPASANVLAAADLTPTLPADLTLRITRTWAVDEGKLVLRFAMTNISKKAVQVGALGIPMIFKCSTIALWIRLMQSVRSTIRISARTQGTCR